MSPRLPVDFGEAQEFGELPEDVTYKCEVTDISDVEQGPNSKYVSAEVTIFEPQEHEGRKLWRNLPITGKGAGFWLQFVRKALGNMDLEREDIALVETEELIGRPIDALVVNKEYPEGSGNMTPQVKTFMVAQ